MGWKKLYIFGREISLWMKKLYLVVSTKYNLI